MTSDSCHMVWFASVSWDGIRGTDWHMAMAMTRHAHIFWVDPPVSPLTSSDKRGRRVLGPQLSVVNDRLTRFTPMALPGLSRWGVRVTTTPLMLAQVRWALRRTDIRPVAVVATHLQAVLGRWGNDVIDVLYGTDDYVAGAQLMKLSADRVQIREQQALDRADTVVAISPQLADRWKAFGVEPVIIPNGCYSAATDVTDVSPGTLDLPSPVVGLVGQFSERIDLDIIEAIANAGYSLLIVGPRDRYWEKERFDRLISRPSVHFAGQVPAERVPSYLAAMDIGITPYRDIQFNRASFPLKTLEYLSAGRPVISTDLPAARWLLADLTTREPEIDADAVLKLARGPSEFVDALRRMTGDPGGPVRVGDHRPASRLSKSTVDRCKAFADLHSWSRRADAFAAMIGLLVV